MNQEPKRKGLLVVIDGHATDVLAAATANELRKTAIKAATPISEPKDPLGATALDLAAGYHARRKQADGIARDGNLSICCGGELGFVVRQDQGKHDQERARWLMGLAREWPLPDLYVLVRPPATKSDLASLTPHERWMHFFHPHHLKEVVIVGGAQYSNEKSVIAAILTKIKAVWKARHG